MDNYYWHSACKYLTLRSRFAPSSAPAPRRRAPGHRFPTGRTARHGSVWLGLAQQGSVWLCTARFGSSRLGWAHGAAPACPRASRVPRPTGAARAVPSCGPGHAWPRGSDSPPKAVGAPGTGPPSCHLRGERCRNQNVRAAPSGAHPCPQQRAAPRGCPAAPCRPVPHVGGMRPQTRPRSRPRPGRSPPGGADPRQAEPPGSRYFYCYCLSTNAHMPRNDVVQAELFAINDSWAQ